MKKLILFGCLGLVAFSVFVRPRASVKEQILRGPASVLPHVQGKVGMAFKIEIRPLLPVVANAGDPILLEATVSSKRDVAQADFAWSLPEGIISDGPVTGSLGALKAGEVRVIRFSGVSQTAENKHIHLHVSRLVGRERLGATTQYNTRDEHVIAEKMRTKAEWLEQHASESGVRQKIVQ